MKRTISIALTLLAAALYMAPSVGAQTPPVEPPPVEPPPPETITLEIVNEIVIYRPIEQVFDFATTAENWKKYHPNTLYTEGDDDHSATVGEEILEYLRAGPIPTGSFHWEVITHEPSTLWQLTTEFGEGNTFLLTYSFTRTSAGNTLFRRTLKLESWKTDLSIALHKLAKPYIQVTSERALKNLKKVVERLPPPAN